MSQARWSSQAALQPHASGASAQASGTHPRNVDEPGWCELDLVAPRRPRHAESSLIRSTSQILRRPAPKRAPSVAKANARRWKRLKRFGAPLPFALRGIDSDSGSEFANPSLRALLQHRTKVGFYTQLAVQEKR